MSKHIRVRYKGLRERRRWAAFICHLAYGITPATLTAARKLGNKPRWTPEKWAAVRQQYEMEKAGAK